MCGGPSYGGGEPTDAMKRHQGVGSSRWNGTVSKSYAEKDALRTKSFEAAGARRDTTPEPAGMETITQTEASGGFMAPPNRRKKRGQ